jgi:hypothetical protein
VRTTRPSGSARHSRSTCCHVVPTRPPRPQSSPARGAPAQDEKPQPPAPDPCRSSHPTRTGAAADRTRPPCPRYGRGRVRCTSGLVTPGRAPVDRARPRGAQSTSVPAVIDALVRRLVSGRSRICFETSLFV